MVVTKQVRTDLSESVRDVVARLNRRLRQRTPGGELTLSQASALTTLYTAGAMTPSELATAERVQPPTMTRIVARLCDLGLVQRTPHPTDRRQIVLAPTPEGRDLITRRRHARQAWLSRELARLSSDERAVLRQALSILDRIARQP